MDYSVIKFGADPTGHILSTTAIQAAIDTCACEGGGRVAIPAGIFLIGTLWLKSNVELHLCHGALLKASTDLADYNEEDAYPQNFRSASEEWNGKHLIIAHECANVAITGTGTIDGSGAEFFAAPIPWGYYTWWEGLALAKDKKNLRPGQLLAIIECNNVMIQDVTLRNATCWSCFLHGCSYVQIRGIKVFNPRTAANTDGIDIDTCSHVTVSDCIIDTGDDAIALRCDGDRVLHRAPVCEFISISNCVLSSTSSVFRIGVGNGTLRHIRVSNITMGCGAVGIFFMGSWTPGKFTHIQDVHFSNISADNLSVPFNIHGIPGANFNEISIEDYTARCCAMAAICASASGWMKNIRLQNIFLTYLDKPIPLTAENLEERGNHFLYCSNVAQLQMSNVHIDSSQITPALWDDPILIENCSDLTGAVTLSK